MTSDCRNCHESLAAPAIFDDSFVAVECPVCGVRGPVRALLAPDRFDQVAKLAIDDWNILFSTPSAERSDPDLVTRATTTEPPGGSNGSAIESNETNGTGKAVTPSAEKPVLDKPASSQAVTTPSTGEAGKGDSKSKTPREGASVEQSCNKAAGEPRTKDRKPDNGGEAVTLQRHPIADRIERYLKLTGQTVWNGVFTINDVTVHGILTGKVKKPREATLKKLSKELAALERKLTKESPEPVSSAPVEQLPNNFKDPTGINRAPAPTAPPRCGRTP
jgi:hypothetical protein